MLWIFSGSSYASWFSLTGHHLRRAGQIVDGELKVLLEHPLDLRERLLLADPGDPARAGERHLRHRSRLDREGAEVLRLQRVDVRLAARTREHLHLERERVEEVVDPLRGVLDDEPLAQLGILGRDAHGAAAGVAVVALARRDAD